MMRRNAVLTLAALAAGTVFGSLLPPAAVAGDQTDSKGSLRASEQRQPNEAPTAVTSSVLGLAHPDALFAAYSSDLGELLRHPMIAYLTGEAADFGKTIDLVKSLGDGPGLISFAGMPVNPFSWRIRLAKSVGGDVDLFALLERKFAPSSEEMQYWHDGSLGHLSVIGPITLAFDVAFRDGVVFMTNEPGVAQSWYDGNPPPGGFLQRDDILRLRKGLNGPIDGLAYLDLRSIVPLAKPAMSQSLPKLYEALQLDLVEFVGMVIGRKLVADSNNPQARIKAGREVSRTVENQPEAIEPQRVQRLVVGLREINAGLWRLVASSPSPITLGLYYPDDTLVFLAGSVEHADQYVDDVNAFLATIDETIVREFEVERREFAQQVGFDPVGDFLGNIGPEWAFGVRDLKSAVPLVAVRVLNTTIFETQMHRLRVAFQLRTDPVTYRGISIQRALRANGAFSYALIDDVLLVSPETGMVRRGIDAYLDRTGLAGTSKYRVVADGLPDGSSKFVFVNFERLLRAARNEVDLAGVPGVQEMLDVELALGASIAPVDNTIVIELTTTDDRAGGLLTLASTVIMPSLERARRLSMRTVSMSNAQSIVRACMAFAANHDRRWPASLNELAASGLFGDETETARLWSNPYGRTKQAGDKPFYLYRPIPDPRKTRTPNTLVVLCEPQVHDGGAVVGYMDGHSAWVTSPQAERLIAQVRENR